MWAVCLPHGVVVGVVGLGHRPCGMLVARGDKTVAGVVMVSHVIVGIRYEELPVVQIVVGVVLQNRGCSWAGLAVDDVVVLTQKA